MFNRKFIHITGALRRLYGLRRPLKLSERFRQSPPERQVEEWKAFANFLLDLFAHGDQAWSRRPRHAPFTKSVTTFLVTRLFYSGKSSRRSCKWISLAFDLQQSKRALPPLPAVMAEEALEKHAKLLSSRPPAFNDFDIVEEILREYFPQNWGRRTNFALRSKIPSTACLEGPGGCRVELCVDNPSSSGANSGRGYGSLADSGVKIRMDDPGLLQNSGSILARRKMEDRYDQLYIKRSGEELPPLKAVAVPDAGKFRVITIDSVCAKALQPVQRALQAHLLHYPEFRFTAEVWDRRPPGRGKKGEKLLSVDYSNATDGVDGSFMARLLGAIIDRSGSFELQCLRDIAVKEVALGRRIENSTVGFYQRRGTLMGSLVSFPLLCLWNAIILKKSGIDRLLVNGDDALCWATAEQRDQWVSYSTGLGLEQSPGKTSFSCHYGTFNSMAVYFGHANLSRMFGPISGESYNKTPEQFRPFYKRFCFFPKGEFRPLVGPRPLGGLGGEGDADRKDLHSLRRCQAYLRRTGRRWLPQVLEDRMCTKHAPPYQTWFTVAVDTKGRLTPRIRRNTKDFRSDRWSWYSSWTRKPSRLP